jgi:hypothetical protein
MIVVVMVVLRHVRVAGPLAGIELITARGTEGGKLPLDALLPAGGARHGFGILAAYQLLEPGFAIATNKIKHWHKDTGRYCIVAESQCSTIFPFTMRNISNQVVVYFLPFSLG